MNVVSIKLLKNMVEEDRTLNSKSKVITFRLSSCQDSCYRIQACCCTFL